MRVIIREAAYDDLDRIYAWIAKDRPRTGDEVVDLILESAERLGRFPYLGLRAGAELSAEGIPVTYTAVYAPEQAHFAGQLGAAYAAPYLGRLEDSGVDGLALIGQMQSLLAGTSTRLLVASIRSRAAYLALLHLGVGSITIPPKLFTELFDHTATLDAERGFLADAAALDGA